jgi:hypothetical protein
MHEAVKRICPRVPTSRPFQRSADPGLKCGNHWSYDLCLKGHTCQLVRDKTVMHRRDKDKVHFYHGISIRAPLGQKYEKIMTTRIKIESKDKIEREVL